MKPSEFYEKYWRIDYGNGKLVAPPALSQAEKDFLDSAAEIENTQGVLFTRKRKRRVQVNVEALKEQIKYFPEFLTKPNQ